MKHLATDVVWLFRLGTHGSENQVMGSWKRIAIECRKSSIYSVPIRVEADGAVREALFLPKA